MRFDVSTALKIISAVWWGGAEVNTQVDYRNKKKSRKLFIIDINDCFQDDKTTPMSGEEARITQVTMTMHT